MNLGINSFGIGVWEPVSLIASVVIDTFLNNAKMHCCCQRTRSVCKEFRKWERVCWLSVVGLSILITPRAFSTALLHQEGTVRALEVFLARRFQGDIKQPLLVLGLSPPATNVTHLVGCIISGFGSVLEQRLHSVLKTSRKKRIHWERPAVSLFWVEIRNTHVTEGTKQKEEGLLVHRWSENATLLQATFKEWSLRR